MFLKFKSSLQLNFLKTTCIGCFFCSQKETVLMDQDPSFDY